MAAPERVKDAKDQFTLGDGVMESGCCFLRPSLGYVQEPVGLGGGQDPGFATPDDEIAIVMEVLVEGGSAMAVKGVREIEAERIADEVMMLCFREDLPVG